MEPQTLAKRFATIARREYEKDQANGRIKNKQNFFINKKRRKGAFKRFSLSKKKLVQFGQKPDTVNSKVNNDKCRSSSQLNKRQQAETDSQMNSGRSLRNRSLLSTPVSDPVSSCSRTPAAASNTPQRPTLQVDSDISFVDTRPKNIESNSKDSPAACIKRSSRQKERAIKTPKDCNIMKTPILYYTPKKHDAVNVISPKKPEKKDEVAGNFIACCRFLLIAQKAKTRGNCRN